VTLTLEIDPVVTETTDVIEHLHTDPEAGLSADEAARRLAEAGPNELRGTPPTPKWKLFGSQFNSPLIYLLMAAIVISAIAWALDSSPEAEPVPVDAIVIALIVVLNAVMGYLQESKAADAVAALQNMTQAHSTVLRDGRRIEVESVDLVPGDILVLAEGDEVGADGRILYSAALRIAEASLTGESEPVEKEEGTLTGDVPLGDRSNMVFKGTAVTQGTGRVAVTQTGMSTEMGAIAAMLNQTTSEPSPLTNELNRLGRLLGGLVIIIAAIVMITVIMMSPARDLDAIIHALILAVSLAVAAVPEGLAAILTVVLSMGVQRMARQKAIVKDLNSVETLGSASVIASDKTGTLTRNEMTIQKVVTAGGEVDISGVGYTPEGGVTQSGKPLPANVLHEAQVVLRGGSIAGDSSLEEDPQGEWQIQGDPTEAAFLVAAHKIDGVLGDIKAYERLGEVPFTSARKMMSVVGRLPDEGTVMYAKGAPDVLLANCSHLLVDDSEEPLDQARREKILKRTDQLAGQAYRTLAVAMRRLSSTADLGEVYDEDDETGLCFVGIAAMIDPPRREASDSIAEARGAGIRLMMITGDHPGTAARIASDLGMVEPGHQAVTGAELDAMDDAAFDQAVREHSVFARVAPRHKMRIVDALQQQEEIVAMTGDGVNDAPALKSADIGVAMGITGTEVTKEAANMVLADDNFATIIAAVREGRLIFDNIRKFLRFLLSSNMGEVVTVFGGTVLAGVLGLRAENGMIIAPLLATQILWINLLTDSAPALAMGVDKAVDDVMARQPRRLTERVITSRMWFRIFILGLVMGATTLFVLDWFLPGGLFDGSQSVDVARTAAFTTLVLAQLFNAFNARSDHTSAFAHAFDNGWLWGAVVLAVLLQVAVVHIPFLQSAFGTAALSWQQWLFCLAAASVVLWFEEIRKVGMRALGRTE
jgi:Ca2+-transporting ATPase